jgi:hypothetical protein
MGLFGFLVEHWELDLSIPHHPSGPHPPLFLVLLSVPDNLERSVMEISAN